MRAHYDDLAALLSYPTEDVVAIERRATAMAEALPAVEAELTGFAAHAASSDPRDLEELYTRTFDLQAVCSLDVGYHLFGETYKRGPFLVKMQAALRSHGIDPGCELPDHLPSLLRLVARLDESEDPRGLAEEALLPAIDAMLEALGESPYAALLRAAARLLVDDLGATRPAPAPRARQTTRLPVFTAEMEP
jgi:nitrate reductase molybdenum cofactor assembly chaperone